MRTPTTGSRLYGRAGPSAVTPNMRRASPQRGRKPCNGWSDRGLNVAHRPRAVVLLAVAVAAAGCGAGAERVPAPIPTPIGRGPAFLPRPSGSGPAPSFTCTNGPLAGPVRVHVELFARRRVVVVPARIGVRRGCRYPLRTTTPTGVIELDRPGLTLADFFAVWRMPLSARRLLTFRGPVAAYVDGKRWEGEAGAIPLYDRAEIVLETGGYVPPHRTFLFAPR